MSEDFRDSFGTACDFIHQVWNCDSNYTSLISIMLQVFLRRQSIATSSSLFIVSYLGSAIEKARLGQK